MTTLIKLFYAGTLTAIVILLVAFGIRTFYEGPEGPRYSGPTSEATWRAYEEERADYHRNVFIISGLLGLASVVTGIVISNRLDAIRLGLVGGGLGLILYGVAQGAEDLGEIGAAPIFGMAVVGLLVVLAAGYVWLSGRAPMLSKEH